MRERAQLWIGVSNREESMARVLSRARLYEGTALHARRAASSALIAILAEHGWAHASNGCRDLCRTLEAHAITPPRDVLDAAETLDARAAAADLDATGAPPSESCTDDAAAACLECVTRVRSYVNTVLTRG